MAGNSASEKLFPELGQVAESNDEVTEIQNSYCVNCGKDGITKLLLTDIPFFRQVVVMSFECPYCGHRNNELQPAQQIANKGVRYELRVENPKDLTRQLVKTEWARVKIPEIDFEVQRQNGLVTTVEGLLDRGISGLQYSVENNKDQMTEEQRQKILAFIEKMSALKDGKETFTLIIEDISGNSFIENFNAPEPDPQLKVSHFDRNPEDDKILGIFQTTEEKEEKLKDEVLQFATNCPNCSAPCLTNMKMTDIPHFKEVIIMATNCDVCGHRTNEIKSGAGIEPKGVRLTAKVNNAEDLKKEVVRSDTCNIQIPELNLTLQSSGSGRYTTIQGLGVNMIEDLKHTNPFVDGDSSREEIKDKIKTLQARLEDMTGLTVILDDPCGNSFVENADHVEHYERTWTQNEELGLNDMKTD